MLDEKRLAELRQMRSSVRNQLSPGDMFSVMLALADAVDEIDYLLPRAALYVPPVANIIHHFEGDD